MVGYLLFIEMNSADFIKICRKARVLKSTNLGFVKFINERNGLLL